jgi:hypothetical protein
MDEQVRGFLQSDTEPFRIASPLHRFLNSGLTNSIENVGGYDTLVLQKYNELINFSQDLRLDEPSTLIPIGSVSPLLDVLNMRYFILSESMYLNDPNFHLVFQNEKHRVYQNDKALPRSFIAHDAQVVTDRDEALRLMASRDFNVAKTALVDESVPLLRSSASVDSPVPKFVERSLNRVLLEANLNAPGLLVLADVFYPGWKCFVDGKENKIYRTDYVLRSVFVPAGKHTVEFKYDPWSFKIGAIISLSTLIALLVWLMWACIRDRKALTVDRYLR